MTGLSKHRLALLGAWTGVAAIAISGLAEGLMVNAGRKRPTPARGRPVSSPRPPQARSNRRLLYVVGAVVAAALVLVVTQTRSSDGGGAGARTTTAPSAGLLRTAAPWEPQTDGLQTRVAAAGFPPVGEESYHVHALLSVYVNGDAVPVPANIGISPRDRYESPLHTHTPDGVIHFEADRAAPFTLQQVFTVWGVDFTADRLGAYTAEGELAIHVYANGERVDDPARYELQDGDNVVVAFGKSGSFPIEPPTDALPNA